MNFYLHLTENKTEGQMKWLDQSEKITETKWNPILLTIFPMSWLVSTQKHWSTLKIQSENGSKQQNLNYYISAVHSFMIIHRRLKDSGVKLNGSDKNSAAS